MGGRAVRWAAAAALVTVAAACGSAGDKAGGHAVAARAVRPVGKPVTLTLDAVDQLWASEYATAARRLSGGTIRIDIRFGGNALVDYERRLVQRVRTGRADMASVGARAWDRMGVTGFEPLVAPFAIESLALERRVVDDPLAQRALEGVRILGLVGLALLPGPLRRPLGLARPLRDPGDYAGARFGIRFGGVARESLELLGAVPAGYSAGSLAGLDGAELDLTTLARHGYDTAGSALTANVVLWARPETIVISRHAFTRLSPAQRRVLLLAGREAIAPTATRLAEEQKGALDAVCGRGALSLVEAAPAELAALRTAVRPVYDRLERDVQTRRLVTEIRMLRNAFPAEAVGCPGSRTAVSALEGTWQATVTETAMRASGATAAEATTYGGAGTLEFTRGRWTFRTDRATVTGTYAAGGDGIRLTMRTCTANPCAPGSTTEYTWSVYRDTLTLARRPGLSAWPVLVASPRTRVR